MAKLILFNKPFGVLTQFRTSDHGHSLAEYIPVPGVYPAGRLDKDSEGLLLLTDDGRLQHRLTDPHHKLPKTYWAQVEGVPTDAALAALRDGVLLEGATASLHRAPASILSATADAPCQRRSVRCRNRRCGRATRRSAFARPSRPRGSKSS